MKIVEWFKIEFLLNFINIVIKAKIFSNQALYTLNVTKIIIKIQGASFLQFPSSTFNMTIASYKYKIC